MIYIFIYLKTVQGESYFSFKGTSEKLLQGLLQGNGLDTGFWISIYAILIQEMHKKWHITNINILIYLVSKILAAFMLVDDRDLINIAPTKDTKSKTPVESTQKRFMT